MSGPMRRITLRPCVLPSFRLCVIASSRLCVFAVAPAPATAQAPRCAPDNAGWTLPRGFCAVLVAESLGQVRHLAVAPNGDIFAARNARQNGPPGGVIVLRDTTGDGKGGGIGSFFSGPGGRGIALT